MYIKKWGKVFASEDGLANAIGLFLICVISLFWAFDALGALSVFKVKFSSWGSGGEIFKALNVSVFHIFALWALFLAIFALGAYILGRNARHFVLGFSIVYMLSLVVALLSTHTFAKAWSLETPLIALLLGLLISNSFPLPQWFKDTLLVEQYVKVGIVLMGATLPLHLLLSAGGVAIAQACIITIITFFSIFFISTKVFKLEPSFGATLGAGGSICGVSAAIVIGNAAKAKAEYISVSISIVVFWAVVMVILLPPLCRYLGLDMGVAGAWIGTSEFADAAGLAAAQSLGSERAVASFTLIKVIGRDMFVGIWAVLVAFCSIALWSKSANKENAVTIHSHTDSQAITSKVSISAIWERFPKFILGFIVASILGTLFLALLSLDSQKLYQKEALGFVKELRNWIFVWTFLCIGLSTEFKKILQVGLKPFVAFSLGVAINLPLGFILSQYVFYEFWSNFPQ